jgi:hypothetical protein
MAKSQGDSAVQKVAPDHLDSLNGVENWPESEKDLIREITPAIRTIRYGSIVLTIHNGQLVEVSKNIRIRRNRSEERE